MIGNYNIGKHGLFILSKENIEIEAEALLNKYYKECLASPQPTPIEDIIEKIGLSLEYKILSNDSSILGAFVFNEGFLDVYELEKVKRCNFKEKTIIIDSKIAENDDKRLMFTYGHELGHYITQYQLMHVNNEQLNLFEDADSQFAVTCNRKILKLGDNVLKSKKDWEEWQANYFSSCILIPKSTLKKLLKPFLKDFDIMKQGTVFENYDLGKLKIIIKKLSRVYNTSEEMMKYRLQELGYLSKKI